MMWLSFKIVTNVEQKFDAVNYLSYYQNTFCAATLAFSLFQEALYIITSDVIIFTYFNE